MEPSGKPKVQFAAGGLLWRQVDGVNKLAVIHRPKYDDWSLPKGKPEGDESIVETARREVQEEVGCEVEFGDFAGVIHYPLDERRTKVVLFWRMTPASEISFRPSREVDQLLWLTKEEALKKLSHEVERQLVKNAS